MKRKSFVLTCLILLITTVGFSQSKSKIDHKIEQTLKELTTISSEIFDAGMSGNKKVLEKYLADTYLETDAEGVLRDKTWNLTHFLSSNVKMTYEIEEAQLRKYGNTAVLYYKLVGKQEITTPAETKGVTSVVQITNFQLRVTDTYILSKNRWQLVCSSRFPLRF